MIGEEKEGKMCRQEEDVEKREKEEEEKIEQEEGKICRQEEDVEESKRKRRKGQNKIKKK